ncbi:unnamed protein product [Rotaria socialis]|uniref:Uncharacterized protein n=1 Tax=Rotaria socialis TaxID=392032 RepID=A0A817RWT7_9BILA|nr:unnamed protein product [Rotaria socialis]CAF3294180.1 unnamed protein product [Rotaria socialis]CAF3458947.1 unnamed protein product [Rotaria socialis]CAF3572627.1 unnamed protein product [Rotaria socialis]CAF4521113.1 unnamed protein product [Rotaria socialis]
MATLLIKARFRNAKRNTIFQDDQDRKQQTKLVRNAVDQLFSERIEPPDGDAKFADVWQIENVSGVVKGNVCGKLFDTSVELKEEIEKEWKTYLKEKCEKMIQGIPYRLQLVIENNGEDVHNY